ncbi:hypothetical protein HHL08_14230 [Sphingobium sp. AR-3-1]|uniref:Uncharacterized protein n=1 Tax=Sphingobium psychrophilum TaxID=2728834 RepID=A0A7X9ZUF4_9SPHN|nr:hypothetical protein [Sphingobium psychrophilum]NML11289.1 hypothetical protein [Sphingobium psychrophilum]
MTRTPLQIAIREKTLALMSNPPRLVEPKPRGHREWTVPLAERKAR